MRELSDIREEIDRIDEELTALLCRRLDCAAQVAAYKEAHGLPVLNAERERAVIEQVRRDSEPYDTEKKGYGDANALVFASMMDVSRALQHRQLAAGEALRQAIDGAARTLPAGGEARVVCAGRPGAFAHEAASRMFPGCAPQFVTAFTEVVEAVKHGEADYGVLPVENSSTGSVNEVYDLIMANRLTISAAAEVPVSHCLLAKPGIGREALRAVYSHHQALSQCADYIAAHELESRQYSNTAAAAEMVALSADDSACAIASKKAGEIYGLEIVDENIQTVTGNCTRFIAISSKLVIPDNADKISLLFCIPHVTGSLYRTLARFAMEGLNLTKIESRPVRSGEFEYAFYLDFEGNLHQRRTVDLLCALSEEMPAFTFMGNYRELPPEVLP